MAAPWACGSSSSCLQTQPWITSVIGSRVHLLKGVFAEDGYELLLWDSLSLWRERERLEDITHRMTSLNPKVEAPPPLVLSHLSSLLRAPLTTFTETTPTGTEGKTLVITGTLSGLPFTWHFKFTHAPEAMLHAHLIAPLIASVNALTHQKQALVGIIRRKDREIQDYRESGALVSRRHLETETFDESMFTSTAITSQVLEEVVRNSTDVFANEQIQNLYQNIAMVTMWLDRKANAASDSGGCRASGQVVDDDTASQPPSITTPSNKRQMTTSPTKDEELGRREALQKKLEEEKVRGKKKKKRLM